MKPHPPCRMFELIGIFAVIGWLVVLLIQYLYGLAFFWTVAVGTVIIPVGAYLDRQSAQGRFRLGFIRETRQPVPPERFLWPLIREAMGRRACLYVGIGLTAWGITLIFPAAWNVDGASIAGWIAAPVAYFASWKAASLITLYFQASQWFSAMTPGIVGFARRLLFRLSDNPEHLGRPLEEKEADRIY